MNLSQRWCFHPLSHSLASLQCNDVIVTLSYRGGDFVPHSFAHGDCVLGRLWTSVCVSVIALFQPGLTVLCERAIDAQNSIRFKIRGNRYFIRNVICFACWIGISTAVRKTWTSWRIERFECLHGQNVSHKGIRYVLSFAESQGYRREFCSAHITCP